MLKYFANLNITNLSITTFRNFKSISLRIAGTLHFLRFRFFISISKLRNMRYHIIENLHLRKSRWSFTFLSNLGDFQSFICNKYWLFILMPGIFSISENLGRLIWIRIQLQAPYLYMCFATVYFVHALNYWSFEIRRQRSYAYRGICTPQAYI